MLDLQSILSRVLNDNDQNVKDSYADTLECDRSPTDEYCVCFTQTTEGKVVCTEGKGADIASMSAVEKRGR